MTTDFVAMLTTVETLGRDICAIDSAVAAHTCSTGRTVEWRCDPMPQSGLFQLYASWPCDDDEALPPPN